MRPRLKSYVHFAPVEEGVLLKGWDGAFVIRGKGLYPLMERLAPLMDGTRTLTEICAGASPRVEQGIHALVDRLVERGLVKDAVESSTQLLTENELQLYGASLAFLDDLLPDPVPPFLRFRTCSLLLIGSGLSLRAAARSAMALGLKQIHVMLTDRGETQSLLLSDLARHRTADPAVEIAFLPEPDWESPAGLAGALPYEVVCHLEDHPVPERFSLMNRLALSAGFQLIQGTAHGGTGVVGPWTSSTTPVCHDCLRNRLNPLSEAGEAPLSPIVLQLIGNMAMFDAFKWVTGAMAPETDGSVVTVIPQNLESSRRPLLASPSCPRHGSGQTSDWLHTMQSFALAGGREQFLQNVEPLLDPVTGFLSAHPGDLPQIPLPLMTARFRTSQGQVGERTEPGESTEDARYWAIRAALEAYAEAQAPTGDVTPGYSILSGEPARVGSAQPVIASGHSYAELVGRGLLKALAAQVEAYAKTARVDPHRIGCRDTQYWLKATVLRFGVPAAVFVHRLPAVPASAASVVVDGRLLAREGGRTPSEAVRMAVWKALGVVQRSVAIDALPAQIPFPQDFDEPAEEVPLAYEPPIDWQDWVAAASDALRMTGREAILLPLEPDPAIASAGLLVGAVAVV